MEDKFLNPVRKPELSGQNNVFDNNRKEPQARPSNGVKLTNTVYKTLEFFPEQDPLKNKAKDKALAIMDHLVLINKAKCPPDGRQGWATLADVFSEEKIRAKLAEDIDMLLGYLWIAKSQSWLNSANYLIIDNEYEKIKKEFGQIAELTPRPQYVEAEPVVPESTQTAPIPVLDNTGAQKEGIPNSFSTVEKAVVVAPVLPEKQKAKEVVVLDLPAQAGRQRKILEFLSNNEKGQVKDLRLILPNITKRTIRRDLDELMRSGKIVRFGEFNSVFYKIKQ